MHSLRWQLGLVFLVVGYAFAQDQPEGEPELLTLARKHFDRVAKDPEKNWNPPLTPSEVLLIQKTAMGEFAKYIDTARHLEGNSRLGPPYDINYP
ncbi:MAG: hypothetical protein AABZ47_13320, partial [Planctomycetota bacterium]